MKGLRWSELARFGALAFFFLLAVGLVSNALDSHTDAPTTFWPANGTALALFLLYPRRTRLLSLVFIAATFLASLIYGETPLFALFMAVFNFTELGAIYGAMVALRTTPISLLEFPRSIGFWAVTVFGCAVNAIPVSLIEHAWLHRPYGHSLLSWGLGDALGYAIFTPAIAGLVLDRSRLFSDPARGLRAVTLTALCAGSAALFSFHVQWLELVVLILFMTLSLFAERATVSIAIIVTAVLADLLLDQRSTAGLTLASPPFNEKLLAQLFVISCSLASQLIINVISTRKDAEVSLDRALQDYRVLADNASDIVIRYDRAGVIEFASPSVRQIGYTPEQIVGQGVRGYIHPNDYSAISLREVEVVDGRPTPRHADLRLRSANGDWRWFEDRPAPITDEAGDIRGYVTVLRNVTERRALEEELRRKRSEAEAATVAKSEFLANMSHEIRTPLTGILGFAGLLEAVRGLPDAAQTYADRIAASGRALLSVVNDILDFSKLDADRIELDPHPFDPSALVNETLDLVGAEAARKGLRLDKMVDGALPAAVQADSSRVRQVLLNLLTNAIKFTDAGSVTVAARYLPEEARLHIAVSDTGVGIPEERRDRLFHRFSQVDGSITRQYGGTGLGLCDLQKASAEKMGGAVGFEARESEGSTFWFYCRCAAGRVERRPWQPRRSPTMGSARRASCWSTTWR